MEEARDERGERDSVLDRSEDAFFHPRSLFVSAVLIRSDRVGFLCARAPIHTSMCWVLSYCSRSSDAVTRFAVVAQQKSKASRDPWEAARPQVYKDRETEKAHTWRKNERIDSGNKWKQRSKIAEKGTLRASKPIESNKNKEEQIISQQRMIVDLFILFAVDSGAAAFNFGTVLARISLFIYF